MPGAEQCERAVAENRNGNIFSINVTSGRSIIRSFRPFTE
jgi:hypothetical protein